MAGANVKLEAVNVTATPLMYIAVAPPVPPANVHVISYQTPTETVAVVTQFCWLYISIANVAFGLTKNIAPLFWDPAPIFAIVAKVPGNDVKNILADIDHGLLPIIPVLLVLITKDELPLNFALQFVLETDVLAFEDVFPVHVRLVDVDPSNVKEESDGFAPNPSVNKYLRTKFDVPRYGIILEKYIA
jgi:hypothetical protein